MDCLRLFFIYLFVCSRCDDYSFNYKLPSILLVCHCLVYSYELKLPLRLTEIFGCRVSYFLNTDIVSVNKRVQYVRHPICVIMN